MQARKTLLKAIVAGAAASIVLVAAPPPASAADKIRDSQWQLDFLKLSEAHKITKGAGVTVAVIDTGIDATHPDLKGAVLPGINVTILKEGSPVGWTDEDGHGTAMAGIIAARGTGGRGVLGVAPESKILPIRKTARRLDRSPGLADALEFAAARGASVVNMSFGSQDANPVDEEAIRVAQAADLVLVAAVGNRPRETLIGYPASFPGVVAVGAIGKNGNHADFSITGDPVLLTAPGADITSTTIKNGYSTTSGTSNATAIVAGAAALIRAKFPQLTAEQVVERLTSTAIDKGPKGRDDEYGYGIVNIVGALTAPVEATKPPTGAVPAPPASAATNDDDGLPTSALVAIGAGVLLLVGALIFLVALSRNRRSHV